MKKTILTIILSIFVIGSIGLVGCGGSDTSSDQTQTSSQTSAAQTTAVTSTTQAPASTAQSSSGDMWSDMPVYPGSSQMQQYAGSVPPADDADYSQFEWRYYETSEDSSTVANWCKNQMSSNGWQEQMWMTTPGMSYGMYMKNNENDAAMLTVSGEGDKTVIALWRARK